MKVCGFYEAFQVKLCGWCVVFMKVCGFYEGVSSQAVWLLGSSSEGVWFLWGGSSQAVWFSLEFKSADTGEQDYHFQKDNAHKKLVEANAELNKVDSDTMNTLQQIKTLMNKAKQEFLNQKIALEAYFKKKIDLFKK